MFYLVGYGFMYNDVSGYIGTPALWNPEAAADPADGYSKMSDWFFQMVFCATAMSIVSGTVAERIKLVPFLIFAVFLTGIIYLSKVLGHGAADGCLKWASLTLLVQL